MADEKESVDRLRKIAHALGLSVADLSTQSHRGSDLLDLIRIFSQIIDPERRRAVIDFARAVTTKADK